MNPMPELDALCERAVAKGVFGTKMRSVIKVADAAGVKAIVEQQFEVGKQILGHGLVPILEPEVDIHSPSKAEAEALRQISDNLVDNAISYTPEHGDIRVEVSREDFGAVLRVADTGIGIPEDSLGRIFERFYRVDKGRSRGLGGTGLGLSIVRNLVGRLHGEVRVESELGVGTTFTVVLPHADNSVELAAKE